MKRRTMRRIDEPGTARFLTFGCYRRLPLFQNPRIRDHFVQYLTRVSLDTAMPVLAWVVMLDHVHLIVYPDESVVAMSRFLHTLKRSFGVDVIRRWQALKAPILARLTHDRTHRFWQKGGGYDRNVTDRELLEKIHYIHLNPLRKGLVEQPAEYSWSSAAAYEGKPGIGPTIDFSLLPTTKFDLT